MPIEIVFAGCLVGVLSLKGLSRRTGCLKWTQRFRSIWHPRSVGVKSGPFGGMRTPELEFEKPEEVYSFCGSNSVWYVSLGGAADHMGQQNLCHPESKITNLRY